MTLEEVLLKNAGKNFYHNYNPDGMIKNYSVEMDSGGNIATIKGSNTAIQLEIDCRSELLYYRVRLKDSPCFEFIGNNTGKKYYFYIDKLDCSEENKEQKKRIGSAASPWKAYSTARKIRID